MEHKEKYEAWGDDIIISIRTKVKGKGMITVCNMAFDPDAVEEQNDRAQRIVEAVNSFDQLTAVKNAAQALMDDVGGCPPDIGWEVFEKLEQALKESKK